MIKTIMKPLNQSFFTRPAPELARALLGCELVHTLPNGTTRAGLIVECEAYLPENDPAAHGARGQTKATAALFGPGGTVYVHPMRQYVGMDIVAGPAGQSGSVLLRALEPTIGADTMPCPPNGPGKLCKALGITRAYNGLTLNTPTSPLTLGPAKPIADDQIATSPRIGLTKATHLQLRFYIEGNPFLSRKG
jgi:DNA-3-methyladenine glycosylase